MLQARDAVSNPDASPISYAAAVGNVIENDLFYAPKSRLGLAVLLRGTGMVLHREILEQHPWSALSNTEDIEYSLSLIERGIATRFLPEVSVWSDFPENAEQLQVQRRRWASGSAGRAGVRSFRLIGQGLRRGEARHHRRRVDARGPQPPHGDRQRAPRPDRGRGGAVVGEGAAFPAGVPGRLRERAGPGCVFRVGDPETGRDQATDDHAAERPWVVGQLVVATILGSLGVDRSVWRQTPRTGAVKVSGLERGRSSGDGTARMSLKLAHLTASALLRRTRAADAGAGAEPWKATSTPAFSCSPRGAAAGPSSTRSSARGSRGKPSITTRRTSARQPAS